MLIVLVAAGCASAAPAVTTPPLSTTPAASGKGMNISGAQAAPIQSNGNAVIVVATIRNETAQDDKLTGGSSPGAALVALYATCACASPEPTDPETGLVGKSRMPWWLIKRGETVQLRAGDGELIVSGLPKPLAAGQTLEVTFDFTNAAPVTVTVPVVASIQY